MKKEGEIMRAGTIAGERFRGETLIKNKMQRGDENGKE